MPRKHRREHDPELDRLVQPSGQGPQHPTGAGPHGDRRTKRQRDRSAKERRAIEEQDE